MLSGSLAPSWFFFAAIFGLVFGSFATVLIARLPTNESLWTRSACPHCSTQINASKNIPLISYFLLKGRCGGCSEKISWTYPAIEASMAALFIAPLFLLNTNTQIALWIIFAIIGLPLTVIDLKVHRLPDRLTVSLFIISLIVIVVSAISTSNYSRIKPSLIGAISLVGFYFLIAFISRGGMGFGDVKLSASIGLVSGYFGLSTVLVSSFSAFFLGSVIGIAMMIFGSAGRKTAIPFGPFMIAGQFISLTLIGLKIL